MTNSTTCQLWPNKPDRCHVLINIQRVFCCLSLIGCLCVGSIIVILKKHHILIQKLILSLSISAFLKSIALLMGDVYVDNSHYCKFQGFAIQYFSCTTLMWVLIISVNCLLIVKALNYQRFYYWYHGIAWVGSFLWCLIPFFGDWYGPAGIWCWVKREQTALRFIIWYVPLLLICIVLLVIYLYIIWFVIQVTKPRPGITYSQENELSNKRFRDELKPLLSYPLIYFIFTIPVFMYRIDDAAHPNNPPDYALTILSVIFTPSIGLCNALAFAVFNASIDELTFVKLKQGVKSWFSSTPSHVIHENYKVDDTFTPLPGSVIEMGSVKSNNVGNGLVSYQSSAS